MRTWLNQPFSRATSLCQGFAAIADRIHRRGATMRSRRHLRVSPHFSLPCATAWHKQCLANRLHSALLLRSSGTLELNCPVW